MLLFHNKFDSTISLGVCYWCVKMPHCDYMEYGLNYITFHVKKIYSGFGNVLLSRASSRHGARVARFCETALFTNRQSKWITFNEIFSFCAKTLSGINDPN